MRKLRVRILRLLGFVRTESYIVEPSKTELYNFLLQGVKNETV